VSDIINIFGDYAKAQSWGQDVNDIRHQVYRAYQQELSPTQCRARYNRLRAAHTDLDVIDKRYAEESADRIIALQDFVDQQYDSLNQSFGRNSQGMATFLGNLVEQYSAILAASSFWFESATMVMEKPSSQGGMLTGFLVKAAPRSFVQSDDTVVVEPIHDREDVILGRRLNFEIALENRQKGALGTFLAPLVVISCKVYVDLPRLENVRAKAESAKHLFPRSLFLVAAQTNALSLKRFCLDVRTPIPAAMAPVDDIFFFRSCKRQEYDRNRSGQPMQAAELTAYAHRIRQFLSTVL